MSIMVTGGTGFIGHRIIRKTLARITASLLLLPLPRWRLLLALPRWLPLQCANISRIVNNKSIRVIVGANVNRYHRHW